jgi:hypothetical protein
MNLVLSSCGERIKSKTVIFGRKFFMEFLDPITSLQNPFSSHHDAFKTSQVSCDRFIFVSFMKMLFSASPDCYFIIILFSFERFNIRQ